MEISCAGPTLSCLYSHTIFYLLWIHVCVWHVQIFVSVFDICTEHLNLFLEVPHNLKVSLLTEVVFRVMAKRDLMR